MVLEPHFELERFLPRRRCADVKRRLDVEYLNGGHDVSATFVTDCKRHTLDRQLSLDGDWLSKETAVVEMFGCGNTQRRVLWNVDFHFGGSFRARQDLVSRVELFFNAEPAKLQLLDLDLGHAAI